MASSKPPSVPQLTEDTVRELLAVQKQELALRLKEVERDSAEIGYNRSIAQQSIEAQERDRKHEREENTKRQKTHQNFVLFVILVILGFSAFAMMTGHAALVIDLAKIAFGFVGGMGYWAFRSSKKPPPPQDPD